MPKREDMKNDVIDTIKEAVGLVLMSKSEVVCDPDYHRECAALAVSMLKEKGFTVIKDANRT